MKSVCFLLFSLGTVLLLTSCSMNRMATRQLSAALTGQSAEVFTGEEDIELARDALPFTLKLYETMLLRDSTNSELLLVTAKLFTLYAQAFVLFPADTISPERKAEANVMRKRAKRLLLRGRGYAVRAFSAAHPGAPLLSGKGNLDSLLEKTTAADTAFLYWVAASWLGAAAADKSDLGLMMTVRKPVAMLKRVCELDDGFDRGAAHELLAVVGASAPKAIGGGMTVARAHFKKALAFSEGKKCSPYVTFAATLCGKGNARTEYGQLLQRALAVDPDNERSLRLQNEIYRERARYLLGTIDRCFPPPPPPVDSTGIDVGDAVGE